jgi:DnaD/phage-associated family protein
MNTWIKLYRKFIEWEWYTDVNCKVVFLHLLLTANTRAKRWQGREVGIGEVITGRNVLADEVGLTVQQTRTALKKLCESGEIEVDHTNRFSVIKIVNFQKYQEKSKNQPTNNQFRNLETQGFDGGGDSEVNQQITNNQPSDNQQITTPKELKNDRNIEYKIIDDGAYYNNINNNIKAPAPPSESGEVFKSYEQNIGVISPIVVDILKDRIQSQGAELVLLAIAEAVKNNAKTIRYIEKVLNAWDNDGIKTADAARLRIAERSQRMNAKDTLPKNVQNSSFRNYPGEVLGDAEKEAIRKMMANNL